MNANFRIRQKMAYRNFCPSRRVFEPDKKLFRFKIILLEKKGSLKKPILLYCLYETFFSFFLISVRNEKLYFRDKEIGFLMSYVRKAYIKPATKSTKVTTLWRFIILALLTVDLTSKKSKKIQMKKTFTRFTKLK